MTTYEQNSDADVATTSEAKSAASANERLMLNVNTWYKKFRLWAGTSQNGVSAYAIIFM